MSIAELKLKVIEKLTAVDNKELLNAILEHLNKNDSNDETVHHLSKHFDSISKRYDKAMKKLAK